MVPQEVVLDYQGGLTFFRREELQMLAPRIQAIHRQIDARQGAGNGFLGWVDLPVSFDQAELAALKSAAERIKQSSEVLVVAGIGGSYLGARAALEMLTSYFPPQGQEKTGTVEIIFAGHHLSGLYLEQLLSYLKGKEFSINVISKSGRRPKRQLLFGY